MKKLILENPLSPGDVLMSTSAFRDLHKAHPGKYLTDFRGPSGCEHIFQNSPYITYIDDKDPDAQRIRLDYPEIHQSGWSGRPFAYAHTKALADTLGVAIPHTSLRPDIFLSQSEKNWVSQLQLEFGYRGSFWIINAGIKNDYTLKHYPYYQEVVEILNQENITVVQVGQLEHNHPPLEGVLDLRGKTDLRQLFRLSWQADGAISAVSLQMVIMMSFDKPCVVVAGAREGVRWQLYGKHRYLYTNGTLSCSSTGDGCWKSKLEDCVNKVKGVPRCMEMITSIQIAESVLQYYEGGSLSRKE